MKGKPPLLEVQFCWVLQTFAKFRSVENWTSSYFLIKKKQYEKDLYCKNIVYVLHIKANIRGRRCLLLHIKNVKVKLLSMTTIAFLSQKQVPFNWDDEFKNGVNEECRIGSHSRDKKKGRQWMIESHLVWGGGSSDGSWKNVAC